MYTRSRPQLYGSFAETNPAGAFSRDHCHTVLRLGLLVSTQQAVDICKTTPMLASRQLVKEQESRPAPSLGVSLLAPTGKLCRVTAAGCSHTSKHLTTCSRRAVLLNQPLLHQSGSYPVSAFPDLPDLRKPQNTLCPCQATCFTASTARHAGVDTYHAAMHGETMPQCCPDQAPRAHAHRAGTCQQTMKSCRDWTAEYAGELSA